MWDEHREEEWKRQQSIHLVFVLSTGRKIDAASP